MKRKLSTTIVATLFVASCFGQNSEIFPHDIPHEKPQYELSAAMNRVYDIYGGETTPQKNELYTQFKYSRIEGFDYNGGDGTVTRREASRVIKANGRYYVWYNLRNTLPLSTKKGEGVDSDNIPDADWNLCDIAYATSTDGFTWHEEGIAIKRPAKPTLGWKTLSTPDILIFKGRYYLYYQAAGAGESSPITVAWADSPDGPWTQLGEPVISYGEPGAWDEHSMHNPQPMLFNGKVYLYYRSNVTTHLTGLAIADNPLGPFVRCSQNPVMNSGHKAQMFRYKNGIAAMAVQDGIEANTIQFSEDGVNFDISSICIRMPTGAGVYDPDAFTDSSSARGITWGIAHVGVWGEKAHTYLLRFDCDLSSEIHDPQLKQGIGIPYTAEELFRHGISPEQRERAINAAAADLDE